MSAAFTLYGDPASVSTARVTLALEEAGITDYEYKLVSLFKGDHKKPEYLSLNPYGKVPTLVTPSGTTIYESRAILKYLARSYPSNFTHLVPDFTDPVATAAFEVAENIEAFQFSDPAGKIVFERFFKAIIGMTVDEDAVSKETVKFAQNLDVLDTLLDCQKRGREYMAGEKFGLVDLYYVPGFAKFEAVGLMGEVEKRGNVMKWWERVKGRPVVEKYLLNGVRSVEEYREEFLEARKGLQQQQQQ